MKLVLALALLTLGVMILSYQYLNNTQTTISKKLVIQSNPTIRINRSQVPIFDHIVIIVMENKSLSTILGNSDAPFINTLTKQHSYSNNYSAITHPSLPNYLALIGGSTFNITSDCTNCYLDQPNLIDRLELKQVSWKAYQESMPTPCFIGNSYPYAQKHNPFVYFNSIRDDTNRCQKIVPLSQLADDLKNSSTTPKFIWITPNLCHDMHDCSIKQGDDYLEKLVAQLFDSPAFKLQKSLLILTWDEDEGSNNQVLTVLAGSNAKKGFVTSTAYSHYSLLHTIETAWEIEPLTTHDARAPIMADFFNEN